MLTEHSVSSVNVVQDTYFACDSKGAQVELRAPFALLQSLKQVSCTGTSWWPNCSCLARASWH